MICILATSFLMFLWVGGVFFAFQNTTILETGWMDGAFDIFATIGAAGLAYVLFPILLPVIASLFLDGFMEKIARHEYGKELRKVPLHEELPKSLGFIGKALLYNLLCLPLYAILFFTGFAFVLYYALNGYLLAKEFWVMACDRMMIKPTHRNIMRGTLMVSGAAIMFVSTIPPFTLIMPLIAASFMIHLGFAALKDGRVKPKTEGQEMQPAQDVIAPE